MADKKQEMIEAIKSMTVLEVADLVKALEEEFGVSAAAPVAVAEATASKRPLPTPVAAPVAAAAPVASTSALPTPAAAPSAVAKPEALPGWNGIT